MVGSLITVGAGCISFNSGPASTGPDGGMFKSADKGVNWAQKSAIATTGDKRSISSVNVIAIEQDPEDASAFYIGTTDNGMFYSYDAGESWLQPAQLSHGRIPSLAIDAKNKCVVYVAAENKVLKTVDCSRTWNTAYFETRTDKLTTAVAVDHYDPNTVWVGNSSGDLSKSTDAGLSWKPVKSFDGHQIVRIAMSPADSRKLYVATKDSGVWRSADGGDTWKDLSENYKDFEGSRDFADMTFGVSDPATIVMASKYGLIRSTDGGDKWSSIELLTPPNTAAIYSVALDPKDTNGLYYGTATTFYSSPNGGVNWVTKKLPTSRAATVLLVDSSNQNVIYLGATKFK